MTALYLLVASAACGQQPAKPLTNADVVKLLSAGLSEHKILNTIRAHPASFETSRQARARFDRKCAAIKPAGVSAGAWATEIREIWEYMENAVICRETNGRGGEDACVPNPQYSSSPEE